MYTADLRGLMQVGPCSYQDNGQCMGDSTDFRTGTALLCQENFSLFPTFWSMSLLLSRDVELARARAGSSMHISRPVPWPGNVHTRVQARETTEGDKIRCCGCATWFHEDCVEIELEEDRGVWPCPECRMTSANVKSLMNSINDLVNLTEVISNRMNELKIQ